MLVKFVQEKKDQWNVFLDTCVFAYNTSKHASSKFPPFELMFNRRATLPIDIELRKHSSDSVVEAFLDLPEPDSSMMASARLQILEEAKQNILQAQQKQKELYDRKHAKPELFAKGQLVLKKDFTRKKRKGGKLDSKFLGPYVIVKALKKGTYILAKPDNRSQTLQATGDHLKPYIQDTDEKPVCYLVKQYYIFIIKGEVSY